MVNMLIALCLVFLNVIGVVFGVVITDLFTVQTGTDPGTCDAGQVTTLNNWVTESYDSVVVALAAVQYYNENSVRGNNVRQAMFTYFKIPNRITATVKTLVASVNSDLTVLQEFFNGDIDNVNPARAYLFCDSEWLIEQDPEEQAYDFQGNPVVDSEG
ncbi:hypothetical protein OIDMADRAFT_61282 [Oidiodendron maius Zn]|uniref:Uncharacterized protein n=1 Tax=Oidiodendron maius (strain Zn) TaxID=913774 RepID=A0A0C3CVC9_OIDMZ|nr:hypothetical protein OIDMADRAFT_61282 [Oidiodendron maius Zn]